MGLFDKILRKKDGVPTLVGKQVLKVTAPRRKRYVAACIIKYDGQPLRKFDVNIKDFSQQKAKSKVEKRLEITVVRVYEEKRKRRWGGNQQEQE